jgi:ectoine hydroxylase-related dioxygenase (phytanoyl-CoA dioxygenase family)
MVVRAIGIGDEFARLGHSIVLGVVQDWELPAYRAEADRLLADSSGRGGVRNVLQRSTLFESLAANRVLLDAVAEVVGPGARAVKATLFDKTPSSNWKVPFHQDVTITVRERIALSGFGPWSIKDGVLNVQAPESVLRKIVAARVHLDDADEANGALRVVDGSHQRGRIASSEASGSEDEASHCPVSAGDAMLMSPLLLHASSPSKAPRHRRVVHFEFTACALPGGLEWN